MQPIVNGLEETYAGQVTFRQLNAATDGEAVYDLLGLRGHPSFVIVLPDGTETYRAIGAQDEAVLVEAINAALANES